MCSIWSPRTLMFPLVITQQSNIHCHTWQDYRANSLGIKQSTLIWLELKRYEPFLPCQLRETLTTINKTDYNIQSIWDYLHFKWQQLMDWNPPNDSILGSLQTHVHMKEWLLKMAFDFFFPLQRAWVLHFFPCHKSYENAISLVIEYKNIFLVPKEC